MNQERLRPSSDAAFLEKSDAQPVKQTVSHRAQHSIHDHRSCNDKHFGSNTVDPIFLPELHCRGYNRVGKTGDGYQCSRTGMLGNIVVQTERCQNCTQKNHGN